MKKFKIPSIPSTTNKTIRMPDNIIEQVEKKSAVKMALEDLEEEDPNHTDIVNKK